MVESTKFAARAIRATGEWLLVDRTAWADHAQFLGVGTLLSIGAQVSGLSIGDRVIFVSSPPLSLYDQNRKEFDAVLVHASDVRAVIDGL